MEGERLTEKRPNLRQEQAAETKRKLLDAAQKLFAKNGYAGTPVRSINRSLGLADGILYHYFPGGKKELFQAVIAENLLQIMEEVGQRASESDYDPLPLEEVIDDIYQGFDSIISCHFDIIRIVLRESEVRDFIGKEQLTAVLDSRRDWFPELLRQRACAGEIQQIDYESAAEVLMSIMMNHIAAKLLGLGPCNLENGEIRKRLIHFQVELWKRPPIRN